MRRGRMVIAAAALFSALLFGMAGVARAATPQDICKDLADGHVDGTYTAAEWTAFFNDPTIQGYGCSGIVVPPTVTPPTKTPAPVPVVPVVAGVAAATHTAPAAKPVKTTGVKGAQHTTGTPTPSALAPLSTAKKAGTLPFTGAQLALFLLVGLGLVATGLVLRATGRRRPGA